MNQEVWSSVSQPESERVCLSLFLSVCMPAFLPTCLPVCNRNHQTSKAPFESVAQGSSLFTSAVSNQRDCSKDSPREVEVRLPEDVRGGRMAVRKGVVLGESVNIGSNESGCEMSLQS